MPSTSYWTCTECGRVMMKKNFYTHLKNVHRKSTESVLQIRKQINKEAGLAKVICPLCNDCFVTYDELAQHCQVSHAEDGAGGRPQDYSIFSIGFKTREDYEQWLTEISEETCTSFSKDHAESSGSLYRQRLLCHRAGVHRAGDSTKPPRRNATTKKIVRHCSCHLVVTFNDDGTVFARGCLGHVGHDLNPALLRLSSQQRMYLKSLLEEHSMDYIINRLREEEPSKSSKLSFVEKSDLRNIARKYNVTPRRDDKVAKRSLRIKLEENGSDGGSQYPEPHEEIVVDEPKTISRERRAICNHKLRAIRKAWSVVDTTATSLAKLGTNEAMEQLEEILRYLQLAARFAQPS